MVKEFIENIRLGNIDVVTLEYLQLLVARATHSSMSLELDLGNPDDAKNAIRFRDSIRAFNFLLENLKDNRELSEELIIKTADIINSSSLYISNGYRKIGGKTLFETDIPVSLVEKISSDTKKLLEDYKEWMLDSEMNVFIREALFHIGFIRVHPFEDGNGRTARLLLNYNLIKSDTAPVVITDDLLDFYHDYIRNYDVEGLANLFCIQSKKEANVISEIIKDNSMGASIEDDSSKKR